MLKFKKRLIQLARGFLCNGQVISISETMTLLWNEQCILDYFNKGEEACKMALLSGYEDKNDQA